jgi:probable rRNA maturation factor
MARAGKHGFSITRISKDRVPALPFGTLKQEILGDAYDLSLVFADDATAQRLNLRYRKKNYIPNVLSFPLGPSAGEIFINIRQAKKEHAERGQTLRNYIAMLFVHGCWHLKGMRHGSTMEGEELRVLKRYVRGYVS